MDNNIEALYRDKKIHKMAMRCSYEILRNKEEAEDIVHDVFERLQQLNREDKLSITSQYGAGGLISIMVRNFSLNKIKRKKNEVYRIYAITTNVSLNRIREKGEGEIWELFNDLAKKEKQKQQEEKAEGEIIITSSGSYEQAKIKLLVKSILNEKDEKTRDIYFIRYHVGMTLEEIGEVVGLGKSAVQKRLKNFEEQVRIELSKEKI